MKELNMTEKFTVEDIRKLREYNASRHKKMSVKEIIAERKKSAKEFLERVILTDKKFGVA